jgi:hypothetical protein
MASSSKTTNDDKEIRKWVEEMGGKPAIVKGTEDKGKGAGLLRIDFIGNGEKRDESLEIVSWDQFFKTFEEKKLSFLYQDRTAGGEESRFFKFVNRE